MKRILIYDTSIEGHHLEYLHHIYMAIGSVYADFIFAIPEKFSTLKEKIEWPARKNVTFDLIPESEIRRCCGNYCKDRWNKAKLAAKYIKKNKADEAFFVELVVQFPFLPLFIPNDVKVSGILYRLVPYEWNRLSLIPKIKDAIEVCLIGRLGFVKSPMCLNDHSCACYYNKRFKTRKFISIVDPVNPLNYVPSSRRIELGLGSNDKMILHFGGMTIRKGTLMLLEAACLMSKDVLANKVFVFAGKVSSDIKETFDKQIKELQSRARVIVYEGFCTYELLSDLCYSCDCIVVPYRNTSYSSGVIGYASLFQKTVIGPGDGLLGKLITRNGLGLVLKQNTPSCLAKLLDTSDAYQPRPNCYPQKEAIEVFNKTIIDSLVYY